MTRNVSVNTGPSRYTQNISIAARSLVIGGQLRSNCEAEWKPQSGDSEQIGGLTPLIHVRSVHRAARYHVRNFVSRAKDKLFEKRCRNQKASERRFLNFHLHIAGNCLNECGDDLVPTEGWGDRSQNCLHDVRVIGDT